MKVNGKVKEEVNMVSWKVKKKFGTEVKEVVRWKVNNDVTEKVKVR